MVYAIFLLNAVQFDYLVVFLFHDYLSRSKIGFKFPRAPQHDPRNFVFKDHRGRVVGLNRNRTYWPNSL